MENSKVNNNGAMEQQNNLGNRTATDNRIKSDETTEQRSNKQQNSWQQAMSNNEPA
jgi:hypothetical protein